MARAVTTCPDGYDPGGYLLAPYQYREIRFGGYIRGKDDASRAGALSSALYEYCCSCKHLPGRLVWSRGVAGVLSTKELTLQKVVDSGGWVVVCRVRGSR
jgi:hypothetical protein